MEVGFSFVALFCIFGLTQALWVPPVDDYEVDQKWMDWLPDKIHDHFDIEDDNEDDDDVDQRWMDWLPTRIHDHFDNKDNIEDYYDVDRKWLDWLPTQTDDNCDNDDFLPNEETIKTKYTKRNVSLVGLSYQDCGNSEASLRIRHLKVHPEPIKLPGSINISAAIKLRADVKSPLKVHLTVKKKVFCFWAPVYSTTYNHLCSYLPTPDKACPKILEQAGIPCRCPFKAGKYSLPPISLKLPRVNVPVHVPADTHVMVEAKLMEGQKEIGCLRIKTGVTIQS